MGGSNPYIKRQNTPLPKGPYKLIFANGPTITVDPEKIPYSDTGLPGSILEIALAHGVEIDHACGGVCACSTCHVYITQGAESCSGSEDAEQDMLDHAPDLKTSSRLACQCIANGSQDVVIEIPGWNRNLVREGH